MKKCAPAKLILIVLFLCTIKAFSQNITISGYIKDDGTKEALIGATIYETKLQKGATANEYGFYSLTLSSVDTLNVVISYIGYMPVVKKIYPRANIRLDILLTSSTVLDEVIITATRNDDNVNKSQVGVIAVPMQKIKNLPACNCPAGFCGS